MKVVEFAATPFSDPKADWPEQLAEAPVVSRTLYGGVPALAHDTFSAADCPMSRATTAGDMVAGVPANAGSTVTSTPPQTIPSPPVLLSVTWTE